ncbi:MAG: phage tail protein [Oscillospiraceae bacterium]|nr:phage tail protein [Oscillospiraceae bacterium]
MLILKASSNGTAYNNKDGAVLSKVKGVCITEKINGERTLSFEIPVAHAHGIASGRTVLFEDEEYRVAPLKKQNGIYSVSCEHMFVFMAKRVHLPSICSTDDGDFIGEDLYKVAEAADKYVGYPYGQVDYYLLKDKDIINEMGYVKLSGDIDYEATDKTTLWETLQNIITYAGRGELLYGSNLHGRGKSYALVETIGKNSGAVINLPDLSDVDIETDISDTVTMLWPYGANNMDITAAKKNISKTPYILSPLLENTGTDYPVYGKIPGTKTYDISDIETSGPDKLFERALWEFDPANPDRIDVPTYNISGNVNQLGLPVDIALGDTVTILDGEGNVITERVIQIKRYPESGKASEVEIGRVKRDMFFYLNRLGILAQRYNNISATNGKIYGTKVTGNLSDSVSVTTALTADSAGTAQNVSNGVVVIDSSGLRVLSDGGSFINASGEGFSVGECIVIKDGKAAVNTNMLRLNNMAFTTDGSGNLYFNGQLIQFAEGDG